ncbi:MAG: IgGFc-binding protein [Polyangiaceae bacterium]|nr:IgGFc-binding protein [Polyangiaceae bacterium]
MRPRLFTPQLILPSIIALSLTPTLAACSATNETNVQTGGSGASGSGGSQGGGNTGGEVIGSGGQGGKPIVEDPKTCAEAADSKSYVGCDFWPTVVDNIVWEQFDYAVVVANAGTENANVTVTRNNMMVAQDTVPPSSLKTLYLPWVSELKGTDSFLACTPTSIKLETVRVPGGAYHLTTDAPVTVYQFNAIEYAGKGGPPGKDWSECNTFGCQSTGCFSFTNDASLLLPSTALTGNYRVTGMPRWLDTENDPAFEYPPYVAITGVADNTMVSFKLSNTGNIAGGGGISTTGPGQTVTFPINAGEVIEVVGGKNADLSGSLITASQPVQVISGIACSNVPNDVDACDHLEESVFPAETLGKRYFVTVPTSHHGTKVQHVVRIYGNFDGTSLTYPGLNPGGPAQVQAGEVVDLGVVSEDFEVVGSQPFAVASFQVGANAIDPGVPTNQQKGDPSLSLMTTVEQYRTKYVFLAPADYDVSFVDVVQPLTASLTLDGATPSGPVTPISSGFGIARIQLGPGNGGAHVLTSTEPVGIQVIGYGTYTSYQYPGGLNLSEISIAPPK